MPNEDFNIKVVTTADTAGLKATSAEMEKLKQQQATFASSSRQQAADSVAGFTGTAVGLGTIIGLVTRSITLWKEFNAEQDKWVEGMIKAEAKARELGEAILEIQDKARNAARVGVEPLYQSFIRLQQEIIRLKTEQNLLDLPRQGEEWKKLNAEIAQDAALLKGVTSELQKQEAAAKKKAEADAEAAASFMKGAVASASPQTQAVLKNEEAARQAREAGLEKDADLFQKTADQLKASMSQSQREEYEGLTKPVRLGRKAGVGESQEAIDEIARQQINFERQLRGEAPLPQGNATGNQDLITAINDLKTELLGIWR